MNCNSQHNLSLMIFPFKVDSVKYSKNSRKKRWTGAFNNVRIYYKLFPSIKKGLSGAHLDVVFSQKNLFFWLLDRLHMFLSNTWEKVRLTMNKDLDSDSLWPRSRCTTGPTWEIRTSAVGTRPRLGCQAGWAAPGVWLSSVFCPLPLIPDQKP